MSNLLSEYEARLSKRETPLLGETITQPEIEISNLKFSPNGEIKPFYGLTTITWIDEKSALHAKLSDVQQSIQAELGNASADHNFYFLEPASFHMTICDITAQSTPLHSSRVETVREQIRGTFSGREIFNRIKAQVRGLALTTTITALVRFEAEEELQKVLHLESEIKQATQVDVRKFLGHITLAYCVKSPYTEIESIQKILQPYQSQEFGALTFSEFDLTYFTDMNTYLPLETVNFETGHAQNHSINLDHNTIAEAANS